MSYWDMLHKSTGWVRFGSLVIGTICTFFYLSTLHTTADIIFIVLWLLTVIWFILLISDIISLDIKWTKFTDILFHFFASLMLLGYGASSIHVGGVLIMCPQPSDHALIKAQQFYPESKVFIDILMLKRDLDAIYLIGAHTFILGCLYLLYSGSCVGVGYCTITANSKQTDELVPF